MLPARRRLGNQHLIYSYRPYRLTNRPPGKGHRDALHEPGSADEAGGSHPGHRHFG